MSSESKFGVHLPIVAIWKNGPWRWLALVALIYLATNSGRVGNEDAAVMLDVTRSMLRGGVSIPEHQNAVRGVGDALYSPYGPLVSIVWIPAVVAAGIIHRLLPSIPLEMLEEFAASFCSAIPSLTLLGYSIAYWRDRGISEGRQKWGVIVIGLATLWWPYSKLPMSDPWMALGIVAAVFHWQKRPEAPTHALLAGLWLGVAWLSRKQAQMLVPLIFLSWWLGDLKAGWKSHLGRMLIVVAGMLPWLGVQLAYNWLRFGNFLTERYPNLELEPLDLGLMVRRIFLLSFDTGNGFLWFNLATVTIGALAWRNWWRLERGTCLVVILTSVTTFPFLSRFYYWNGGGCFGPRYLLFLTGLLGLGWAYLPTILGAKQRLLATFATLTGTLFIFAGVVVDSNAVNLRLSLNSRPGTLPVLGYFMEMRRVAFGEPKPFSPELAKTVYATHPAFQVPDFWWCHLLHYRRAGTNSTTPVSP